VQFKVQGWRLLPPDEVRNLYKTWRFQSVERAYHLLVPSLQEFLCTYSFDWVALLFSAAMALAYAALVRRSKNTNRSWPIGRTIAFSVALGIYVWVNLGFFGTFSYLLRWAFTTRIALLLFGIPLLIALGRPVDLARQALAESGRARLEAALKSWPIRLMGNAIFAPLFALAFFMLFVTPLGGALRESVLAQNLITVFAVLLGTLMILPLTEREHHRSEIFIVGEFMIAFAELMLDAIPGVLLSINNVILDHAPAATGNLPAWFPTPMVDQHFSGNLLWMIAESVDIPILVMLFIRWGHSDRRAAKSIDDLSDEEFEALAQAHLRHRNR